VKTTPFLIFPLLLFCFFGGCRVDNTQKIFDKITVSSEHHSFVYLFADQVNYFSDDAESTIFNAALTGVLSGVNASKMHGMLLFPDTFLDTTLYTSAATVFKGLFDNTGNNSFNSYPSIAEGLVNYGTNYSNWKRAIDSVQNAPAVCGIGMSKDAYGSNINVNVKVNFYRDLNDSVSVALYVVQDDVQAIQIVNPNDTAFSYKHKKVLRLSPNGAFGEIISVLPKAGTSQHTTITAFLPPALNSATLEYIVVVYAMGADRPIRVLNCASLR
jgi:hypothetical protein